MAGQKCRPARRASRPGTERLAEQEALQPYLPPGGLEAAAKAILQRLERRPVKVDVKDPKDGPATVVTLGKEDFQRDVVHKAADVGDGFRTPVETPIPILFAQGD